MRNASWLAKVLLSGGALLALFAQAVPQITSIEPGTVKAGEVITASGTSLDAANVAKVYLTDGKTDIVASVSEQTATAIKITLTGVKPGRYGLMIELAKNKQQIDQPVKFTVE